MSTAAVTDLSTWGTPSARIVLRADATRAEWLAERRHGLGGSDASTIADLNPYSSRYELWLDKTGRRADEPDNEAMEFGRRLEPVLAAWFADLTNLTTRRCGLLAHRTHSWMRVSVDRLTSDGGGLEVKTAGWRMQHEWSDGQAPDHAELQSQWAMAVTGRKHWWVIGLIGDRRAPLIVRIERDDALIRDLIWMAERFWRDNVLADVEPAIDPGALPAVKARYSRVARAEKQADSTTVGPLVTRYTTAKQRVKDAQADVDTAEGQLRNLIGDAESLQVDGQEWATCRSVTQTRIDAKRLKADHPDLAAEYAKQSTFRKLTIK